MTRDAFTPSAAQSEDSFLFSSRQQTIKRDWQLQFHGAGDRNAEDERMRGGSCHPTPDDRLEARDRDVT